MEKGKSISTSSRQSRLLIFPSSQILIHWLLCRLLLINSCCMKETNWIKILAANWWLCMNTYCSCRCMKTFQQLKKDYAVLRKKLEAYFQVIFHSLLFEKMVKIEESDSKMCTLRCLLSSQSIHLLSFSLMIQLARQVGPVETACRRKWGSTVPCGKWPLAYVHKSTNPYPAPPTLDKKGVIFSVFRVLWYPM